MLEQLIKQHPEKYQPYDLLAQLLDDEARSLQRAKRVDEAKDIFPTAAANYAQRMLSNPNQVGTNLHLAELLREPLKPAQPTVSLLEDPPTQVPAPTPL